MRPQVTLLASLGLLIAALGCHHTAGVCDCDVHGNAHAQVLTPIPASAPMPTAASAPRAEAIKDMPKSAESAREKTALSLEDMAPAQ